MVELEGYKFIFSRMTSSKPTLVESYCVLYELFNLSEFVLAVNFASRIEKRERKGRVFI